LKARSVFGSALWFYRAILIKTTIFSQFTKELVGDIVINVSLVRYDAYSLFGLLRVEAIQKRTRPEEGMDACVRVYYYRRTVGGGWMFQKINQLWV
jgi:hypothetical protein